MAEREAREIRRSPIAPWKPMTGRDVRQQLGARPPVLSWLAAAHKQAVTSNQTFLAASEHFNARRIANRCLEMNGRWEIVTCVHYFFFHYRCFC
jgi:hypothetical protein